MTPAIHSEKSAQNARRKREGFRVTDISRMLHSAFG
jgi:hypothetical protein